MQQQLNDGRQRVVITGTGLITPLGLNVPDTWSAILAGKSGMGEFTLFEKGDHRSKGVCEVKNFDPAKYLGRRKARRQDRFQQFATVAGAQAMEQSGLQVTDENRERIGLYIGTGVGGIETLVNQERLRKKSGLRRLSPFGIAMIMPNGAAGLLAIDYGIHGSAMTVSSACAASNDAVGHAFRAIRYGELDVALTGGTEAMVTSVALGGFEAARATSTLSSKTPKPFDLNRDGLVIGEGGAILVLESLEHAQSRDAVILGEIAGYGSTVDAHHITAPAIGGAGAARAIRNALADGGLEPEDVDYINAHGTGTQLNDVNETMAIKTTLGNSAYDVAVSSTKSMTGHIMGATAAIETVLCALAIRDQVLPPTINYETPDPECDLDYVPNQARRSKIKIAMNNAFGFGGHNSVLIIKEFVA